MQVFLKSPRIFLKEGQELLKLGISSSKSFDPNRKTALVIRALHQHCLPITSREHDFQRSDFHKGSGKTYCLKYTFQKSYYLTNPLITARYFSLSPIGYEKEPLKPSSKVEATVNSIKEKSSVSHPGPSLEVVPKKTLKQRAYEELMHYWHGFKLLFNDIKISTGLCFRLLRGKTLTRREHRLLIRTVGDMFRLVPFSVFIIVPFLEFTLPLFIKFFPEMLPSTFQTTKDVEDKMKQSLKMKLEVAKFLQKTLDDMACQGKGHKSQNAKEFSEWFHKVRKTGAEVTNDEIMKFSKLFEDDITLDSLTRSQLAALCRVVEVGTLGTTNFLKFQLRMKLRKLAADDKMIQKEGLDSLTLEEVQLACKARGMRAYGLSEQKLRQQLAQWIDLSLNQKVPPTLLLLSRSLMIPENVPTEYQLKATIMSLPEDVVTQTKAAIGEKEGKIDNKVKLEILKEEERKIQEERREMIEAEKRRETEKLRDVAQVLDAAKTTELRDPAPSCTNKDFEALESALDSVAKEKKKLIVEKEEIQDLKEELADYKEDVHELQQVTTNLSSGKPKSEITESKAAKRLYNKVNSMIGKMDKVLNDLEKKEKQIKTEQLDSQAKNDELIRIDELMSAIKKIMNVPDNTRLEHIERVLGKIDDDRDGSIKVEDVLKVVEVIGKENVQLNTKQIDELIDLIEKEELLEVEDKIEKALYKDRIIKPLNPEAKENVVEKSTSTLKINEGIVPPPIPPMNPESSKSDNKSPQL